MEEKMLSSIEQIWLAKGQKAKLKVRFRDWNFRIKYFEIEGYSQDRQRLMGKLDTGEVISFAKDNLGWLEYHAGLEDSPRAI